MSAAAQPLIDYLHQLERKGETHVHLDTEARAILRQFYINAAKPKPNPKQAATPTKQAAQTASAPSSTISASGNSVEEKIASLKASAQNWQPAKALGTLRDTMVFSVGNPNTDIMLVGEAPGYEEEKKQEPFVGPAGQKLDGILKAMGLSRNEVYISNIVKFRPSMPNQTTGNRKPSPQEIASCIGFIKEEISIIQPKVIIALGATAAQALLENNAPVGRLRETFHQFAGIPLRVTYHPSYLLHNEATSEKRKVWEDMLAVMEQLSMPISDKQKGYFLPKG